RSAPSRAPRRAGGRGAGEPGTSVGPGLGPGPDAGRAPKSRPDPEARADPKARPDPKAGPGPEASPGMASRTADGPGPKPHTRSAAPTASPRTTSAPAAGSVRRRLPVRARADRDAERDAELDGGSHLAADQFLHPGPLARGDLQDDLVVDLEEHAGGQAGLAQGAVQVQHGDLDDVGGGALDGRVERHALGGLPPLTVVAVEVGQVAAAAEEGRRVAGGPRLVHDPAQVVPHPAEA